MEKTLRDRALYAKAYTVEVARNQGRGSLRWDSDRLRSTYIKRSQASRGALKRSQIEVE